MSQIFERLVAFYDSDITQFKSKSEEVLRLTDAIEKKFKNLNLSFTTNGTPLKDMREAVRLQEGISRAEKANEQAKRAAIAAGTEQIKQDQERLKLAKQIAGTSPAQPAQGNKSKIDTEAQKADAFIRKLNLSNRKAESDYTAFVTRQAEKQFQARTRKQQQAAEEFLKLLKQQERAEQKADNKKQPGGSVGMGAVFGGNLAANFVSSVSSSFISGGAAILAYSANLEQVKIGFERLEGSSAKAKSQIQSIQNFAATTPLTFEGLLPTAQRFEELGFKGEKLIPVLRDIGNVVAGGVGKPGESLDERMERVGLALKQTFDKNRVQMEELNQLSEAGVNGLEILSKGTGKSKAELVKLVEQGRITGDVLLESLRKVSKAEFGTAMEKQSKTFNGALSTVKDSLLIASSTYFEPLYEKISEIAVRTAKEVEGLDFGEATQVLAKNIAKGFGEALGAELKNELKNYSWQDLGNDIKALNNVGATLAEGMFGDFNVMDYLYKSIGSDLRVKNLAGQSFFAQYGGLLGGLTVDMEKLNKTQEQTFKPKTGMGTMLNGLIKAVSDAKKSADSMPNLAVKLGAPTAEQQVRSLKTALDSKIGLLDIGGKVAQAGINAGLDLTTQQQLDTFRASNGQTQSDLRRRIDLQAVFFNQELALYKSDAQKTADITEEKNKVLGSLRGELVVNEINAQKQISQFEHQIQEQRRQDAIEFTNLLIKNVEFSADRQNSIINRNIDRQVGDTRDGFGKLKQLAQTSYQEISDLTRDQYEKQLDNLSLTDEQRTNIIQEMYLAEKNLAEQNRRSILDIEDRQYQKSLENLETGFNRRKAIIENFAQNTQFGISLLSPEVFTSNSSSLIQRALTGNDLPSLKKETVSAFTDKGTNIERAKKEAQIDLDDAIKSGNKERVSELAIEIQDFSATLIQNSKDIENWGQFIDDSVWKVASLVEKIKSGGGMVADFDKLGFASLELRQNRDNKGFDAEIEFYDKKIQAAVQNKNTADIEAFTYAKLTAERNKNNAAMQQEAERAAFLAQTTQGLTDSLNKLLSGDKVTIDLVKDGGEKDLLREKTGIVKENILLEQGYYKDSVLWAEKRKNALLNFEREIYEARKNQEIQESIPLKSRIALQQAQLPSYSEMFKQDIANLPGAMADVLGNIAQQWDGTWSGLFKGVARGFGQMLADMAQQYLKAAISKLIGKLVGSLLGLFGGGSSAPIGDSSGGFGGFGISAFADGGSPPVGRISLVGERGPELFIPKQAGTILSNEDSLDLMKRGNRSSNGQTVNNITVNQTFKTPRSMTAPKSTRQQSSAAISGISKGLKRD